MKKTTPLVLIALSYAEASAMSRADAITRFQVESSAGQRAFSAMGKLFRVIEASLTAKDKGIFPLLMKAGIPKGSVSNASYAAKVFDLVDQKLLTEAEYDTLSHSDCFNAVRVQSKRSALRLTAEEVVLVIQEAAEPDEELCSIYETGMRTEEVAAKKVAAEKIRAASDKIAAEKAVTEAAEIADIKAENEKLKAKAANDKLKADPSKGDETADPDPSKTSNPVETETVETVVEPVEGISLQAVLDALNSVELAFAELDADSQAVIAARVVELAECLTPVESAPAKKAKKKITA